MVSYKICRTVFKTSIIFRRHIVDPNYHDQTCRALARSLVTEIVMIQVSVVKMTLRN